MNRLTLHFTYGTAEVERGRVIVQSHVESELQSHDLNPCLSGATTTYLPLDQILAHRKASTTLPCIQRRHPACQSPHLLRDIASGMSKNRKGFYCSNGKHL